MNAVEIRSPARLRDLLTHLLLLSVVSFLVLLPNLGQTRHLGAREGRHAEIIREMAESGDYLVPTLLGREYPDKPPVMHAMGAVFTKWTGAPSLTTARLPSALAAWLAVLAIYAIGRLLIHPTAALVGAIALLGMPGFSNMARQARPDMILCAAIFISGLALLLGMREQRPGLRALAFCLAGVFAGVGTLTKGPWGFVFPVLLALLVSLAAPDWRRPQAGWILFALGLLLVMGAWAIPVYLRDNGRYLRDVLLQPDLQVTAADSDPLHRYVKAALIQTLPISLFLPLAIRDWWRRGYSPLLAFSLAVVLIFCLIPKKRPHYLLPMYPSLAMGVVAVVVREAREKKWLRQAATITIGTSVAAVPLYFCIFHRLVTPAEDPDLQEARQLLAETPPNSRVYTLAMQGDDELLAWVGHRKIQVINLGGDEVAAIGILQSAPAGTYLGTTSRETPLLEYSGVSSRLILVKELRHSRYNSRLYRFGGTTN